MFRIARLSVVDHLRSQYRSLAREPLNEVAVEDQTLTNFDAREAIEYGLSHLHPIESEAIVLHYIEQLSLADVADICDVPVGTIKSRLHRARKILNDALKEKSKQSESTK